jgi:regulator of sigma E protease
LIGYILVAVLIFGVLIFVHELGHFLVAKRTGVQVNEFAICMGPTLWSKKRGETTYSLRAIPIGGFCAMEGEDGDSENPRAFTSAAVWKRFCILIAGSAMNFLAGLLILVIIFSFSAGFTTTKLSGFSEGATIAEETGLQAGDTIYRIDGKRVYFFRDISLLLGRNATGNYAVEVIRDGEVTDLGTVPFIPREFTVDGKTVVAYGLKFLPRAKSVGAVLEEAWFSTVYFTRLVWMGLGDLISGMVGLNEMAGPVGIVSQIAQTGKTNYQTGNPKD